MPFLGGLALLIAVICCFHAVRNDKPNWWLFLLIGMPGIGSAIYFLAVVLPEVRHSKKAKLVVADVTKLIDPERDYRQAANDLGEVETVTTLTGMAAQLAERERFGEAAALLERCLTGPHEHDPDTLLRLSEA